MGLEVYPVGEARLRTLVRWRRARKGAVVQAVVEERYRSLDTEKHRRQLAAAMNAYVFGLAPDQYSRYRGAVRSGGKLDVIVLDLILESELLRATDRFTFRMQYDQAGERFEVLEAHKLPQGFGSDGCVPLKMRARFQEQVVKHPVILEEAKRCGRDLDAREIRWDWQPRWHFPDARLSGRLAEQTLRSLFDPADEDDLPVYILLATWSFSAQQQDWGERGRFVQVVIDPEAKEVIHQMGDEWHLLY